MLISKVSDLLCRFSECRVGGDDTDLLLLQTELSNGLFVSDGQWKLIRGTSSSIKFLLLFVSLLLIFSSLFLSSLFSIGSEVFSFTVVLCLLFSAVPQFSSDVALLGFSIFSSVIFLSSLLASLVFCEPL